ncbi:hypothetical protein G7046_g2987 [Stylonectria norvegica]|nr:hypothetical protein G7046_g2987 [Stylonectria norvegica]
MHFTTTSSIALLLAGTALAAPHAKLLPRDDVDIDSVIPSVIPVNQKSGNAAVISQLLTVATHSERVEILSDGGDFVFDFNADVAPEGSTAKGDGGISVSATAKTFPALIGNGGAMTVGFLGPCGMNTAHVHNRATEFNIVVKGRLVTNFVLENKVRPIENTLSLYQMAVFPKGAIHQEFNPDCEDTVFVAGFDNEDPGVSQIAQNFFSLRKDVVQATLGGIGTLNGQDIDSFREQIPANIALGIETCLDRCGLQRNAKRDLSELI